MTEPIEDAVKRLMKNLTPTDSETEISSTTKEAGQPDCEICGGLGYVRTDHPVGHPDFGKLEICACRQAEVNRQVHKNIFAYSQLNELQDLTFENFEPRGRIGLGDHQAASLEYAYNQAKQYASSHNGWLLLRGRYGSGKTHLAAAIANFAVQNRIKTLFITVPDLLDSLRFSYNSSSETSFEERFEEIRKCPFLILDDFGTQNATQWAQEKLFQIINYRYINRLPMVITTNLELDQIEGRIRSRLEDPALVTRVHIQAPDYRRPMEAVGYHELSTLSLHGAQTFETFRLRKSENIPAEALKTLETVSAAAKQYAADPKGWLVLFGSYGSGKTHLAAAIANHQINIGAPPLFIVVPDLLDHLRATFSPDSVTTLDRRFDEIKSSPLLILDDLGTQNMTPWVREKLYQLFNYRYTAQLPTVITTSDNPEEMDPRIMSRIQDNRLCKKYYLNVQPFTGKKS